MTIGTHVVMVGPTGSAVDLSCWVDEVTVNHGRDNSSGQPEPSSCTLTISVSTDDPLPAAVEIGAPLNVSTHLGATSYPRFQGSVTDVSLAWDEAGAATPDTGVGQIVAMGQLATLGRRVVGAAPFPQQLDGARVKAVLDAAGQTYDPAHMDPGTVQILARDIDSQPCLGVAQDAAVSASGILWQSAAGDVRYADADHRRGAQIQLVLDACDIEVTPTWQRNLEGLINQVSIGYGPEPGGGGEQPRYLAEAPASKAKYDTYDYTFTSVLADLAAAQAMGQLLMVRNSEPVWILSAMPLALRDMSEADTATVLGLDMHSLIQVTGLPAIGGAPTSLNAWVEGWRERLAFGTHELELVVSGYCRTSAPPRWNDIDPTFTWDTVKPAGITWDGAACLGPPVDRGRWDDVAATLRWDQIAPTITWDTWGS